MILSRTTFSINIVLHVPSVQCLRHIETDNILYSAGVEEGLSLESLLPAIMPASRGREGTAVCTYRSAVYMHAQTRVFSNTFLIQS